MTNAAHRGPFIKASSLRDLYKAASSRCLLVDLDLLDDKESVTEDDDDIEALDVVREDDDAVGSVTGLDHRAKEAARLVHNVPFWMKPCSTGTLCV